MRRFPRQDARKQIVDLDDFDVDQMMDDLGMDRHNNLPLAGTINDGPAPTADTRKFGKAIQKLVKKNEAKLGQWASLYQPTAEERDGLGEGQSYRTGENFRPNINVLNKPFHASIHNKEERHGGAGRGRGARARSASPSRRSNNPFGGRPGDKFGRSFANDFDLGSRPRPRAQTPNPMSSMVRRSDAFTLAPVRNIKPRETGRFKDDGSVLPHEVRARKVEFPKSSKKPPKPDAKDPDIMRWNQARFDDGNDFFRRGVLRKKAAPGPSALKNEVPSAPPNKPVVHGDMPLGDRPVDYKPLVSKPLVENRVVPKLEPVVEPKPTPPVAKPSPQLAKVALQVPAAADPIKADAIGTVNGTGPNGYAIKGCATASGVSNAVPVVPTLHKSKHAPTAAGKSRYAINHNVLYSLGPSRAEVTQPLPVEEPVRVQEPVQEPVQKPVPVEEVKQPKPMVETSGLYQSKWAVKRGQNLAEPQEHPVAPRPQNEVSQETQSQAETSRLAVKEEAKKVPSKPQVVVPKQQQDVKPPVTTPVTGTYLGGLAASKWAPKTALEVSAKVEGVVAGPSQYGVRVETVVSSQILGNEPTTTTTPPTNNTQPSQPVITLETSENPATLNVNIIDNATFEMTPSIKTKNPDDGWVAPPPANNPFEEKASIDVKNTKNPVQALAKLVKAGTTQTAAVKGPSRSSKDYDDEIKLLRDEKLSLQTAIKEKAGDIQQIDVEAAKLDKKLRQLHATRQNTIAEVRDIETRVGKLNQEVERMEELKAESIKREQAAQEHKRLEIQRRQEQQKLEDARREQELAVIASAKAKQKEEAEAERVKQEQLRLEQERLILEQEREQARLKEEELKRQEAEEARAAHIRELGNRPFHALTPQERQMVANASQPQNGSNGNATPSTPQSPADNDKAFAELNKPAEDDKNGAPFPYTMTVHFPPSFNTPAAEVEFPHGVEPVVFFKSVLRDELNGDLFNNLLELPSFKKYVAGVRTTYFRRMARAYAE